MLASGGAFLGFLEAIGLAVEGDDLGVMDQPVDERDDASGIAEHLVPLGKRPVRSNDGALLLVAPVGQFEQQVGLAVGVGEVANLVDAQQVEAGVVAQPTVKGESAAEGGQLAHIDVTQYRDAR